MSLVVVDQAEEVMLDLLTAADLRLVLFTNDLTAGLTPDEVDELTEADLTLATFPGYAAAVLTGGAWTTSQGNPSTASYAAQTFTRSSTGTAQLIQGYAVLRDSDGFLLWFEQLPAPISIEISADEMVITPRLTLDDTKGNAVESGTIVMTTRSTAPIGWLLCDGAAHSRSTYPDLDASLAAEGYPYGDGDGSTTFNVPNLQQRFPMGKAAAGTGAALGDTGGSIDHVHNLDNTSAHAQIHMSGAPGNIWMDRASVPNWTPSVTTVLPNNVTANGTLQALGTRLAGDTDSENPPYIVVNFMVKT